MNTFDIVTNLRGIVGQLVTYKHESLSNDECEAVEEAINAVIDEVEYKGTRDKSHAQKPKSQIRKRKSLFSSYENGGIMEGLCPRCINVVDEHDCYCPKCGQKLDWRQEEDNGQ